MTYPIFNSFTNKIENQLTKNQLNITTFKTWHEDRINATGLEIGIDLSRENNFIKEVCINFDWDRFRETVLAQQLKGLATHPMLQKNDLKSVTVSPKIDIEMSWIFDEQNAHLSLHDKSSPGNLDNVGQWMEEITKKVNDLLAEDDGITRWHIEIEGARKQKHLTAARLISYFQYSLADLNSLNEAHAFIENCMHELIDKSQKVRSIADETLKNVA